MVKSQLGLDKEICVAAHATHKSTKTQKKRKPRNMVASGPSQKAPLSPSSYSYFHPQRVFDHT